MSLSSSKVTHGRSIKFKRLSESELRDIEREGEILRVHHEELAQLEEQRSKREKANELRHQLHLSKVKVKESEKWKVEVTFL